MDFRVQAVLSAVWPTARRPLAPVVVLGIDILDALGMTSSEEASPPLVFEPEPGVVQELREAVMIRTPSVEYEDIGRFWEVGIRHDLSPRRQELGRRWRRERGLPGLRCDPFSSWSHFIDTVGVSCHLRDLPCWRYSAYKVDFEEQPAACNLFLLVAVDIMNEAFGPPGVPSPVCLAQVAVTGSVIFHSIAAAALAAFSIGMASRLPEKQSRKPMQLASAALALGTLREMVLVNLDRFSFVGDLAVQLFNFAPDPGAAVVATHYLSDAISMPIIVAFLGTFSGEPQIVRTALHCVMPVAMFNLLAAGSALVVTPGREVALLVGSLGSMVYFFWGLSHIEEKVPAADQDTFKEVRMSSDLLRMTMCLIGLVQVGGATHCLPPEWQHHMLTVLECLFVGVCHLPLRDRDGGRVRLQSLAP
ncbi:hypothetical protein AK812_SmicGene12613 [Symbiodinium microadriaticum]|uniref:Uncharacterized protein n=1 Tax=Symbiodinium microadriaticum TaxID=2951 RepID=A0A1Q9EA62_SYMMI|nr:hypothetical protein AK812_SmicGene12613 [Symbiodinium microadriaticum]